MVNKIKKYKNSETLKKLYWEENLSMGRIANRFNVSKTIIAYFMKKYNIPCRHENQRRLDITNKVLIDLYLKKKLSIPKIAELLDASSLTIWRKIKKYRIELRPRLGRPIKYPKTPFSNDPIEKSYMLGLRTGDLYAKKSGKQIQLVTGSTHPAQFKMFQKTFEKYSRIYIRLNKIRRYWYIECLLDKSFKFLLKKLERIPYWILNNTTCFYAFLAGYSDCEASWSTWKPKGMNKFLAKYQLSTSDRDILYQIKIKLQNLGFMSSFGILRKKNQKTTLGKYNKDMYFVYLNRQKNIREIAKILLNYSKHEEKIWKMKFILQEMDKNCEDVKSKLDEFKRVVKETRLDQSFIMLPLPFPPHDETHEVL